MAHDIERRVQFGIIRYANCWEDANVLCEGLDARPGMRVLSIASGGDNVFALLAEGAAVVAADLSQAQLACVELKAAALRRLEYADVLAFFGIRPSKSRLSVYMSLRPDLSDETRAFWDRHTTGICRGLIHVGKFERFFRLFRKLVLPLIHSRATIESLMAPRPLEERAAFYEQRWDNRRWRLLFRVFMSRFVMGRLGRDPEFFRYVKGPVGPRILDRVGRALSTLPLHRDPYLDYILHGNFTRALPRYLEPERFEAVRAGLDRLTLVRGAVQDAGAAHAAGGFDGFNLSDVFEYLGAPDCLALYRSLLDVARPGARLVYWNMLAPRRCPLACAARVNSLDELASKLFAQDLAFFYSALVIEEVGQLGL